MLAMKFIDESDYEGALNESLWEVEDSWKWSDEVNHPEQEESPQAPQLEEDASEL
jgi:hypothetical protein